MESNLTPELLQNYGFIFEPAGRYSGADMWQGMAFWKKDDIILRGNISTARGGRLYYLSDSRIYIDNEEELCMMYRVITHKQLIKNN